MVYTYQETATYLEASTVYTYQETATYLEASKDGYAHAKSQRTVTYAKSRTQMVAGKRLQLVKGERSGITCDHTPVALLITVAAPQRFRGLLRSILVLAERGWGVGFSASGIGLGGGVVGPDHRAGRVPDAGVDVIRPRFQS